MRHDHDHDPTAAAPRGGLMNRFTARAAAAVLGALGLTAGLLGAAAPAQADTSAVELPPLVAAGPNYQQDLQAEVNYWTLATMAAAGLNDDGTDAFAAQTGWDNLSAPWPGGQGLVSRTAGKLFMRVKDLDSGAVTSDACSADVVTSANQSVVLTAGHCLAVNVPFAGALGVHDLHYIATNVVFVPGYNGADLPRGTTSTALPGKDIAPYGVWGVTRSWITNTWSNSADWALGRDMAALLVANPTDPRPIAEVTGAQQVAFNQPQNQYDYMFGYPQTNERNWYWPNNNNGTAASNGAPQALWRGFDGRSMMVTQGQSHADPVLPFDVLDSAQAPGCSGGPWLQNFDPATGAGVQTAVNSRYNDPNRGISLLAWLGWLQGPQMEATHFGDEELAVYQAAQSASR
ncbi:hypothetical protein P3T37_002721 [Kitasatospora sp. MAA4]|uniref:trypsin-like serine peptidase n=1 Tax=Kitasatospora sp. MAA4 TaxID=3035093 RepID=UPI0024737E0A|nr:hypothetical protein [Kitasatospora sp. MAA4]MDH6133326.1 hypothetical protein [Kitasatospora sp. MAA4]